MANLNEIEKRTFTGPEDVTDETSEYLVKILAILRDFFEIKEYDFLATHWDLHQRQLTTAFSEQTWAQKDLAKAAENIRKHTSADKVAERIYRQLQTAKQLCPNLPYEIDLPQLYPGQVRNINEMIKEERFEEDETA